jgi:hypothetical protein
VLKYCKRLLCVASGLALPTSGAASQPMTVAEVPAWHGRALQDPTDAAVRILQMNAGVPLCFTTQAGVIVFGSEGEYADESPGGVWAVEVGDPYPILIVDANRTDLWPAVTVGAPNNLVPCAISLLFASPSTGSPVVRVIDGVWDQQAPTQCTSQTVWSGAGGRLADAGFGLSWALCSDGLHYLAHPGVCAVSGVSTTPAFSLNLRWGTSSHNPSVPQDFVIGTSCIAYGGIGVDPLQMDQTQGEGWIVIGIPPDASVGDLPAGLVAFIEYTNHISFGDAVGVYLLEDGDWPDAVRRIVRSGDTAPSLTRAGNFVFGNALSAPTVNAFARGVFVASLVRDGNAEPHLGIWSWSNDPTEPPRPVMVPGEPAPSLPGGATGEYGQAPSGTIPIAGAMQALALNDYGHVAFLASIENAVGEAPSQAVYVGDITSQPFSPVLIASTKHRAPGLCGEFDEFHSASINNSGHVLFRASVNGIEGFWKWSAADTNPGDAGIRFLASAPGSLVDHAELGVREITGIRVDTQGGPAGSKALSFDNDGRLVAGVALTGQNTVFAVARFGPVALPEPVFTCDINGDGNVDQDDIAAFIQLLSGGLQHPCHIVDLDVNCDGNVDQDDTYHLINVVAKGSGDCGCG